MYNDSEDYLTELHIISTLIMPAYYFIYLIIILSSSFMLTRYFVLRKKSPAMLLFLDAIKAENKGNYQEAVDAYEGALCEVKKPGLIAT